MAEWRESDHPRSENGQFGTVHVVHSAKHDEDKGWQSQVHSVHASPENAQQAHDQQVLEAYRKMRAVDLEENDGESEFPEDAAADEAWGHLGSTGHVFGVTSADLDAPHDGSVHVVHEVHRDGDGDGDTEVHGVYPSKADADAVADDVAGEVWAKHGPEVGDDISDRDMRAMMKAHNAAQPEDHHVDEDLDFIDDQIMDDVADAWNDEHDEEEHVVFEPRSQTFQLVNRPEFRTHYRKGAGNEGETPEEYAKRSEQSRRREAQIVAKIMEEYQDPEIREAAKQKRDAMLEAKRAERKKFPGFKKSNKYFRNEDESGSYNFDKAGRSAVVENSHHVVLP